ncbi:MAG: hypothetical protein NZ920_01500 [Aigarchaeota archaeon]|nr:hypothetical protein [Aigarchaeota archaeon]MDW8093117.1 hypothetical protein [Nitrososphaerota archaeon]
MFKSSDEKTMRLVGDALNKLEVINNKLSHRINYMSGRSKQLFDYCVKAQMEGDVERASVYASELSQLRKSINTMVRSQLVIESVINRLYTVKDFKEAKDVIMPVMGLVKKLEKNVYASLPEIGTNVRYVQEVLDDVVHEIGIMSDAPSLITSTDSEDAAKILKEASEVALRRKKDLLPEASP